MNPRRRQYLRRKRDHCSAVRRFYAVSPVPIVLTHRTFKAIAREQSGIEAAWQWLAEMVADGSRPIGVNIPTQRGESSTIFVAPQGWSRERLKGHIGVIGPELEHVFGDVTVVGQPC